MHEFGYTFKDIEEMHPMQIEFLLAGLAKYYKDQEKAAKKARLRRR